jgi:hypothetical protein
MTGIPLEVDVQINYLQMAIRDARNPGNPRSVRTTLRDLEFEADHLVSYIRRALEGVPA